MRKKFSKSVFKVLCAKDGSQRHLIFEKWQLFHHGQNWQKGNAIAFAKLSIVSKFKILRNMLKNTLEAFLTLSRPRGSRLMSKIVWRYTECLERLFGSQGVNGDIVFDVVNRLPLFP